MDMLPLLCIILCGIVRMLCQESANSRVVSRRSHPSRTTLRFFANYKANKDNHSNVAQAYVDHCEVARSSGDVINYPSMRCSRWCSDRMTTATSAAITAQQHDRLLSEKNPPGWANWAQDGRKGVEQRLLRCAFQDLTVEDMLIAMLPQGDGKKALCASVPVVTLLGSSWLPFISPYFLMAGGNSNSINYRNDLWLSEGTLPTNCHL
jgi:hypothetical protein